MVQELLMNNFDIVKNYESLNLKFPSLADWTDLLEVVGNKLKPGYWLKDTLNKRLPERIYASACSRTKFKKTLR